MASRAKVRGGEKQQQSLSLGRETVEELEKEAERRGLNKSQLADLLLNGQLTQSADKPTIISIMSYKGGVAKQPRAPALRFAFRSSATRFLSSTWTARAMSARA